MDAARLAAVVREPLAASALGDKLARLERALGDLDSALLAFSGGVDSAFLLRVAHEVLGGRLTALTSVSPTNPEEDTAEAIALAGRLGVRHLVLAADELAIPGYAANPTN